MKQAKIKKWQEALGHWSKWEESTSEARINIEKEYGDLKQLVSHAKIENKEKNIGDKVSIRFLLNDEMEKVWDIDEELLHQARTFISEEIGLVTNSDLYLLFVDYWMQCVFPEFRTDTEMDMDYFEEGDIPQHHIWAECKVIHAGSIDDIEYIVHWRQSKIKPKEVAEVILRAKWPSSQRDLPKSNKGGRPKLSKDLIYSEAIVCFILNKKQGIKQAEIARIFGRKTHRDSYGNLMSNTVGSRVKLGKELLNIKDNKMSTNK